MPIYSILPSIKPSMVRERQLSHRLTLEGHVDNWVRGLAYTDDQSTLVSFDTVGVAFAWNGDGKPHSETHLGQPPFLHAAVGVGGRLLLVNTCGERFARLLRLPDNWWRGGECPGAGPPG